MWPSFSRLCNLTVACATPRQRVDCMLHGEDVGPFLDCECLSGFGRVPASPIRGVCYFVRGAFTGVSV